jgi:hypothetical protein
MSVQNWASLSLDYVLALQSTEKQSSVAELVLQSLGHALASQLKEHALL